MNRRIFYAFAMSSTALVPWLTLTPASQASGCDKSDEVTTCKGDVYPYSENVGSGDDEDRSFIFKELSKDATNGNAATVIGIVSTGEEGDNDGDDGDAARDIEVEFVGINGSNTYGLDSTGQSYEVNSTGGKGHDGKERSGADDTGGQDGGTGGLGGSLGLDHQSGSITDLAGTVFTSYGGAGGDGGEGETTSGTGTGGRGGDGGDGSTVTTVHGNDGAIKITGGVINASSRGGDSGEGGRGESTAGKSEGGRAGNSGAGGDVSVVFNNDITFTQGSDTSSIVIGIVKAVSAGGDGSKGGNAGGTANSSFAGNGGNGGNGGEVVVQTNNANVTATTVGTAIFASSTGGNGGNGGDGDSSLGSAKGGDGRQGGTGGAVTITVDATSTGIETSGSQGHGLFGQSVGGAGGDGGSGSGGLGSGSGGAGAGSGPGGTVNITTNGTYKTTGSESIGIIGQSIGGFSGDAGKGSGLVAYGAGSQSAGAGGTVSIETKASAAISTIGSNSDGIFAQSVGGGGGRGSGADGLTAMGGSGSAGGAGGQVWVTTNGGTVTTSGETSYGIHIQSVGGGGGASGSSSGLEAFGGSAGSGGSGGQATIFNYADVTTTGNYSIGIMAQSTGGGGGSAHSTSGVQSFGGSGGSGGNGSSVTVQNNNVVSTSGDDATGVILQSVGGGGGHGSNAISSGVEFSTAFGGSGGSGGTGGAVEYTDVENTGASITTKGDRAKGVVVQSIGGGGGHGGYAISASAGFGLDMSLGASGDGANGGDANTATASVTSVITTGGDNATAITVQSIGGGGGAAGTTISSANSTGVSVGVAIGGSGGAGGDGKNVTVGVAGNITTGGNNADGILAQSVGGGGGASGVTIEANAVQMSGTSISIGGSGGPGGNAGNVTVSSSAQNFTIAGAGSDGIVAQSTGGAGGVAKMVLAASGATQAGDLNFALGGDGGTGGTAGNVSVTSSTEIDIENAQGGGGIIAQSIGGGGGHGSMTIAGSLTSASSIGLALGGDGGNGGDSGTVDVDIKSNAIVTEGDNGNAVLAQSIGGNGGNGGMSIAGDAMSGGDATVSVSGSGTAGGTAGDVTVTFADSTTAAVTGGSYAAAIKATSHGGGGGNALAAINGTVGSMGAVAVTVGGSGGEGGTGGAVTVTSGAIVTTTGDYSEGIYASSVGGGGGHGGFAVEGALTGGDYSGSASVTVGGGGGAGGGTGEVAVTSNSAGSIQTSGYTSRGIFAQSVGGSGGQGGSAYSGNLTVSSSGGVDVGVTVGGGGGNGGKGSAVTVDNHASITTGNYYSDGIFAQSVGGDGGAGGNAYLYVAQVTDSSSANINSAVGGSGGSGNTAGTVSVTNSGGITINEPDSNGIYAQSVGGGGGRGGSAGSVTFDLTRGTPEDETNVTINSTINVGGKGGSGGHGGEVSVTNSGAVLLESSGYAVFAQSVGGGGGDGGSVSGQQISLTGNGCTFSTSLSSAASCTGASGNKSTYAPTFNLEIGGNGAGGGDGGDVTMSNSANVTTKSDNAFALFAQSTGGGGGVGGNASLGTQASLPDNMVVQQAGYFEEVAGEFAGNFRSFQTAKLVIGGQGGAAGDGGGVTVINSGRVMTSGSYADAIHAQSVGGGGGHGGTGNPGFGSLTTFALGGQGGAGGDGGDVSVNSTGEVLTDGDDAIGIFAQSVGGGGGRAGNITRSLTGTLGVDLNIGKGVGVQLDGGNGGDGGALDVTVDGSGITSTGDYAHGVWAQSTGGSGGAAHIEGVNLSVTFAGGNGSADGDGGDVSVTVDAPISVSGNTSHGIFAQSVSGTRSSSTGGNAGDVTVAVNADVIATGTDGSAMILQSDGAYTMGTITVGIAEGATVSSASDGSDTIAMGHGTSNVINNSGTISMAETSSTTHYAVRTNLGVLTINNLGTFEGSVNLDTEDSTGATITNAFANSGSLGLGRDFNMGHSASTLTNSGTMSAGTLGTVATSDVKATITQGSDGVIQVDADVLNSNDLIDITASTTATLAGSVLPNFVDTPPVTGETGTLTYMTSDADIVSTDLTVSDTSTVTYTLGQQSVSGEEQLFFTYDVDYSPWPDSDAEATQPTVEITDTDRAVGSYVETLAILRRQDIESGANELAFLDDFILSLTRVETLEGLLDVYERMTPTDILRAAQAATHSSLRFSGKLMSCPRYLEGNAIALGEEGSCYWADVSGLVRDTSRSGSSPSSTERAYSVSGGLQMEFAPDWFIGGAFSYEDYWLDTSYSSGTGERYQLGAVVKHVIGNTTLAGSVSGGYGTIDVNRDYLSPLGTPGGTVGTHMHWAAAHARATHRFEFSEALFLEPYLDVGLTYAQKDEYTIDGALLPSLNVSEADAYVVSINPALRIGTRFDLGGMDTQATFKVGVLGLVGDNGFDASVAVDGVGAGGSGFNVSSDYDQVFADLGVTIEAALKETISLQADANALFGETESEFSAGLRLNIAF